MKWEATKALRVDGTMCMWTKRLLNLKWFGIDIHKIVAPDEEGCFHTHPYYGFRIILWGGYTEEVYRGMRVFILFPYIDSRLRTWFPGRIGFITPKLCHRFHSLRGKPTYTLWIHFKRDYPIRLFGPGWFPKFGIKAEDLGINP